jgi:hypothetical protein
VQQNTFDYPEHRGIATRLAKEPVNPTSHDQGGFPIVAHPISTINEPIRLQFLAGRTIAGALAGVLGRSGRPPARGIATGPLIRSVACKQLTG